MMAKAAKSKLPAADPDFDLGGRIKGLRRLKNWTLEKAAQETGLARSTLSKIENRLMSPTFDALQQLAAGFGLSVSALVTNGSLSQNVGRRSVTRAGHGQQYSMPNYSHEFLCTELAHKKFTTIRSKVLARSFDEFPDWVRHPGEDFVLVIEGEIVLYSEFYEPLRLRIGDSVHYDSMMGHALVSVGPKDAVVLWVTSE